MGAGSKLSGLLMVCALCVPGTLWSDTPQAHRAHKAKKQQALPPPLPSGARGPVPHIPLDSIPAVAPQVSYKNGLLTIVAPNSTLGDILRGVRKQTEADIEIPSTASERVVTYLGPGPARDVVAELLNGSHFNYILLGSPENAKLLVRVVLVAKTGPDNPPPPAEAGNGAGAPAGGNPIAEAPEAEVVDETPEETPADQGTPEAEQQQPVTPDQPGVKTPQQMLQEMQQRQLQMQQQQQQGQQNGQPIYPPPNGMPVPQRPPQPPPQEQQ